MAQSYLDKVGLGILWNKIKALIPAASSTTPKMDGTANAGSETTWAKGDHVHPSDTTRVPTTRKVNGKALSSDITIFGLDIRINNSTNETVEAAITNLEADVDQAVIDVLLGGDSGTSCVEDNTALIPVFTGATSSAAGSIGLVPAPASDTMSNVLTGDGSWERLRAGTGYGSDYVIHKIGVGTSADVGANIKAATSSTAGVMSAADKSKLDSITMTNGKIDSSILPSYVDDVIDAYPRSGQTALSAAWLSTTSGGAALTPETGKIYILMAASGDYAVNSQFRWSGSTYVELSNAGVSAITEAEINTICV